MKLTGIGRNLALAMGLIMLSASACALSATPQVTQAVLQHKRDLLHSKWSPVLGNPKGSVTLVEFIDYQCRHCRSMGEVVDALVQRNPQLRVVVKDLVIFGRVSLQAAEAGLYAKQQGKFAAYHHQLVSEPGRVTLTHIKRALSLAGLSVEKWQQFSAKNEKTIQTYLKQNQQVARALGFRATPAFIIINAKNGKIATNYGAVPLTMLQQSVKEVV